MEYAFVTKSLVDLRAKPDIKAERLNQALFCDIVEIVRSDGKGYWQIRKADGYEGWTKENHLQKVSSAGIKRSERYPEYLIARKTARLIPSKTALFQPHFLYYASHLHVISLRYGVATVLLPDSTRIHLKQNVIRPISLEVNESSRQTALVREAKRFLGVPYLWGGLSPAGIDCSGLIQIVTNSIGLEMPRDTKDQIRAGEKIQRSEIRGGDLLFFERHVALALSRTRYIHSSVHQGGVAISSLLEKDNDYREDLDKQFKQARRIA